MREVGGAAQLRDLKRKKGEGVGAGGSNAAYYLTVVDGFFGDRQFRFRTENAIRKDLRHGGSSET